ncbi:hypothetical protein GCM10009710_13220 [Aeromicrobium alkaliterrae]|uniref:Uncharacterized protein n=1 Tax=Aeromicrobium alkaliterrae TaxID=302168 RepID=A0ABP4VSQ8_9ACTN
MGRVVRVFPEYGRDWPLWERVDSPAGYVTTPDTYGLSDDLTGAIAAWNDYWERHFAHDTGWDHPDHRDQWRRDGDRVVASLRTELWGIATVRYEPWPLGD